MDHTAHDGHGREGRVAAAPDQRPQVQPPAERGEQGGGEHRPHRDHAPDGERGRRAEQEGVDHVRRTGQPQAQDVGRDRRDEPEPDPEVQPASAPCWQARQVAAGQQGLKEEQRHGQDAREAGRDVDRVAPG